MHLQKPGVKAETGVCSSHLGVTTVCTLSIKVCSLEDDTDISSQHLSGEQAMLNACAHLSTLACKSGKAQVVGEVSSS